jgi:hypothetical protein
MALGSVGEGVDGNQAGHERRPGEQSSLSAGSFRRACAVPVLAG